MNEEIVDNSAWENDYDDSHSEGDSFSDDMDGDWDSGMASAGWGIDEDYEDYRYCGDDFCDF